MKAKELLNIGFKQGPIIGHLLTADQVANKSGVLSEARRAICHDLFANPVKYFDDLYFGESAKIWDKILHPQKAYNFSCDKPIAIWGKENIDEQTIEQMERAISIPPACAGAIMPDGHLGYGIPVGGVLALKNAVMPFGVGVDIACRMMLTVTDIKIKDDPILKYEDKIVRAIAKHTRFGLGASFDLSDRREHRVIDEEDWSIVNKIVTKDHAWSQLGSSGGGNHFVDIGEIEFAYQFPGDHDRCIEPGRYLAILTHSGSRSVGSKIAAYYTKVAELKHPLLPPQYKKLSWLDLDTEEGIAYWKSMELAGQYAAACHSVIHKTLLNELGWDSCFQVQNHHNFAWKETYNNQELIIHRKGATPAGAGVLGFIPGSMASPGFLVMGKGNIDSLNSAAHGAGRLMSRKKAKETYRWSSVRDQLKEKKVKLISGGLDEVPGAYKDIESVMSAQSDLVDIVARFDPRLVKMADDGYVED